MKVGQEWIRPTLSHTCTCMCVCAHTHRGIHKHVHNQCNSLYFVSEWTLWENTRDNREKVISWHWGIFLLKCRGRLHKVVGGENRITALGVVVCYSKFIAVSGAWRLCAVKSDFCSIIFFNFYKVDIKVRMTFIMAFLYAFFFFSLHPMTQCSSGGPDSSALFPW